MLIINWMSSKKLVIGNAHSGNIGLLHFCSVRIHMVEHSINLLSSLVCLTPNPGCLSCCFWLCLVGDVPHTDAPGPGDDRGPHWSHGGPDGQPDAVPQRQHGHDGHGGAGPERSASSRHAGELLERKKKNSFFHFPYCTNTKQLWYFEGNYDQHQCAYFDLLARLTYLQAYCRYKVKICIFLHYRKPALHTLNTHASTHTHTPMHIYSKYEHQLSWSLMSQHTQADHNTHESWLYWYIFIMYFDIVMSVSAPP